MTLTEAKDWLFCDGWKILATEYGWPEAKARSAVGKLIKASNDHRIAQRAVIGIQDKRPVDPMPWALAGIKKIHEKNAWKHRPGHRPQANLPPEVPLDERVNPERLAKLRAILEEA